jgi:hypothetical protein
MSYFLWPGGCNFILPDLFFFIAAFIENLIEEKQYVAAARFSLAFELVSRYPPEVILGKGVDAMNGASASTGRNNSNEAQACIFYRILVLSSVS